MKDNTEETVKNKATIAVNSSISEFSVLLDKCKDVIMNKQNPKRFAAVATICCDVLLAIFIIRYFNVKLKVMLSFQNKRPHCKFSKAKIMT